MEKTIRQYVSMVLVVMMVFAAIPVSSFAKASDPEIQLAESEIPRVKVNPDNVNNVIAKFTESLSKLSADTSELSKMQGFLTRLGGLTSAAAGVIGVLLLSGVIKDPVMSTLGQVLDKTKDIQTEVKILDSKIDGIYEKLDSIAVSNEEKARNSNAKDMQGYWNSFNTDYTEKLDDLINIYQGKITEGIKAWWESDANEGVWVLYTAIPAGSDTEDDSSPAQETEYVLTYSNKSYSEGLPEDADNEELVEKDKSFGIPEKFIPETKTKKFNINKYRADFEKEMSGIFMDAADAGELECSKAFYESWNAMNAGEKKEAAEKYAADILNTIVYHIACDTMSSNHTWVVEVTNAYRNYCNNVLKQNSGVNAFLNYIYLTHGFEGEAKKSIEDFCDSMIVQAGIYGEFTLSCAGQDDLQSLANRQEIQENFVSTVSSLSNIKKNALTGSPNYCYITGTVMKQQEISAQATSTPHLHSDICKTVRGFSSTPWTISVPNILNNVYAQVLYHQYQTLPEGASSFAEYLHKYGAFNSDDNTVLMTRYGGAHEFGLDEGIRMKADNEFGGSNYFTYGEFFNIDVGTYHKISRQYYLVHDKVLYDAFDMKTGTVSPNKLAGARAYYGETYWAWFTDEAWHFYTDGNYVGSRMYGKLYDDYYTEHKYRIRFNVLTQTAAKDLNGNNDPEDPFFAYGAPSLIEGISDHIGMVYEDTAKPITKITFKSSKYTYTGKSIRPKITVMAGKKVVPAGGYTVTYDGNKEVGYGMVIVKGTGKYSGSVCESFTISPRKTELGKIKKKKTSASVKWKKQTEKMTSERITGYQIRYSTRKSMKGAKKILIKGYKKTSKKITKLKKNKKYYFQIRTYVKTKKGNIYSGWSKKKRA